MPTKICVEVEVDVDIAPEALRSWLCSSLNFTEGTVEAVSADSPEELCTCLAGLDALDEYDGPVRVTKFEPVMAELCEAVASPYPPAAEEPQDVVELDGHGRDNASQTGRTPAASGDFFGPDGFVNVGYCPAELHHAAIEAWGVEANVRRLAEACGELVALMNCFLDGRRGSVALASKVASVLIMVERVPLFVAAIRKAEGSSVTALHFAEWVRVEAKGKVLRLRDRIEATHP